MKKSFLFKASAVVIALATQTLIAAPAHAMVPVLLYSSLEGSYLRKCNRATSHSKWEWKATCYMKNGQRKETKLPKYWHCAHNQNGVLAGYPVSWKIVKSGPSTLKKVIFCK